jgi:hypothetical protein
LNQGSKTGPVNLLSQTVDVDLDCIRRGIVIFVPHVLRQLGAAYNSSGVSSKVREQCVFLGREIDDRSAALHALSRKVDLQVVDRETRLIDLLTASSQKCPQTSEELIQLEWFGEVIVGATVESLNAICGARSRGEHEYAHRRSLLSNAPAHSDSVDLRQIDVEDDRIVGADARLKERILSVARYIDRICLFSQSAREGSGQRNVIFNQKKSHYIRKLTGA